MSGFEHLLDAEVKHIKQNVSPWKVGLISGPIGISAAIALVVLLDVLDTFEVISAAYDMYLFFACFYIVPLIAMVYVFKRNNAEQIQNHMLIASGVSFTIMVFTLLTLGAFTGDLLAYAHNLTGNVVGVVFIYAGSLVGYVPLGVVAVILKSFKQ